MRTSVISRPVRRKESAFTLIEVLVVVAIIALLVAVLLPSLVRARESARLAQCSSNQRQLSSASIMYTVDNRSFLPGPLHPMLFRDTFDEWYKQRDADNASPNSGYYRRCHLIYYIRKYFGEKSKAGALTDKISTCPTAEAIMALNIKQIISSGGWSGYTGYRPFHYTLNSIKVTGAGDTGDNIRTEGGPYHGTKPPFYFGVIYHGYTMQQWGQVNAAGLSEFDVNNGLKPGQRLPKRVEVVDRPGAEWMFADAWYGEVQLPSQLKPAGTWPYLQGSNSSLSPNGLMMIPNYAYHTTTRQYTLTIQAAKADQKPGSTRFTDGRTNAAHFDGHVEAKRPWKGVSNPCWQGDTTCN